MYNGHLIATAPRRCSPRLIGVIMQIIPTVSFEVSPVAPASFGTLKAAQAAAGKVQKGNDKIPGNVWSGNPFECNVGGRLANVCGSVCEGCYARRTAKRYPSVLVGLSRNMEAWRNSSIAEFVGGIVYQIKALDAKKAKAGEAGVGLFRWFGTGGDIMNAEMMRALVSVAVALPSVKFWLPTKEPRIVKAFVAAGGVIPDNLVVRVSSPMIDQRPVKGFACTSTVHKDGQAYGTACPASLVKKGNCFKSNCTLCWDSKAQNISYKKH